MSGYCKHGEKAATCYKCEREERRDERNRKRSEVRLNAELAWQEFKSHAEPLLGISANPYKDVTRKQLKSARFHIESVGPALDQFLRCVKEIDKLDNEHQNELD